jgi:hypothetical protein
VNLFEKVVTEKLMKVFGGSSKETQSAGKKGSLVSQVWVP